MADDYTPTALDELRQALAEWDRLTEAATPGPWWIGTTRLHSEPAIASGTQRFMSMPGRRGDADLIVAAVGLAPTVRAILADAIAAGYNRRWGKIIEASDDALRLARAINLTSQTPSP